MHDYQTKHRINFMQVWRSNYLNIGGDRVSLLISLLISLQRISLLKGASLPGLSRYQRLPRIARSLDDSLQQMNRTRFSPQPSDAVTFCLPLIWVDRSMTIGSICIWGRQFRQLRMRFRCHK
jgi:hypothetical protein